MRMTPAIEEPSQAPGTPPSEVEKDSDVREGMSDENVGAEKEKVGAEVKSETEMNENEEDLKSAEKDEGTVSDEDELRRTQDPDSDYDPESAFQNDDSDQDDDYDPESNAPSLPPKPPTRPDSTKLSDTTDVKPAIPAKPVMSGPLTPSAGLQQAYEAVMQSDIVRSAEFAQLTQEAQMVVIQKLLEEKNISLPDNSSLCKRPDLTVPMDQEEQRAYDKFIEKSYAFSDRSFPPNSRLFVGNLPTHLVTNKDIFRICNPYGEVVQIVMKSGFAFVQFTSAEACAACIKGESNVPLHNRILRLDTSKSPSQPVRGRERPAETEKGEESGSERSESEERQTKRRRTHPDVKVLVTGGASSAFVDSVESQLRARNVEYVSAIIGDADPAEEVSDAAFSGVVGAVVVRNEAVDLQIFEETEEGIKFDEYLSLNLGDLCDVIDTAKASKPRFDNEAESSNPESNATAQKTSKRDHRDRDTRTRDHRDHRGSRGTERSHYKQSKHHSPPSHNGYANAYQPNNYNVPHTTLPNTNTFHNAYNQGLQGYPQGPYQHVYPSQGSFQQSYQNASTNAFSSPSSTYATNTFPTNTQTQNFASLGASVQAGQLDIVSLAQTLQNLDPVTRNNLLGLIQQSQGAPVQDHGQYAANPSLQGQYLPQNHPPPARSVPHYGSPHTQQSHQVNSLLGQLQAPPANEYSPESLSQSQPPSQTHSQSQSQSSQSQSQTQSQPNKAVMDMLRRLG